MSELYMTEDQAEEIIVAHQVGRFFGERSRLAHAHLLLAARDKRQEQEELAHAAELKRQQAIPDNSFEIAMMAVNISINL